MSHTQAKHEILSNYLKAWFPILATSQFKLLYVDGFAGPGEYKGGQDGSPIIALKVARDHMMQQKLVRTGIELVFLFIEQDERRLKNLQKKINEMRLPKNFRVECVCSSFEDTFGSALQIIEEQNKKLAPSFVFIDPFGPTGFPLALIARLARQERSEVLINFNYQAINQWFLSDPTKHERLDELYGSNVWRQALSLRTPLQKEEYLMKTYKTTLEKLGWRGRPFRMINKHNQTQYYLFFVTRNWRGMLVMKQAMWSAAPLGDFKYSDLSNPLQTNMFEDIYEKDYSNQLAEQLYQKYKGTTVTKMDIIQNDLAWHPICIGRHLTEALRTLESQCDPSKITDVKVADNKRRTNSFPERCSITFAL